MDLSNFDFRTLGKEKQIDPMQLAREFVQLEFLKRIAASSLKECLSFKGGTAMHLVYNLDRYSEDLDFSLSSEVSSRTILSRLKKILSGEDITDAAIKRRTVLVEVRQPFRPQNFRVKFEVNTNNVVPSELKSLFSEYRPESFNLQIMRQDYLVAQKTRAFIERDMARDLYDLWFILRTRMSIDFSLLAGWLGVDNDSVKRQIEEKIKSWSPKEIVNDLNPFIKSSRRAWIKASLKQEVLEAFLGYVA